MIDPDAPIGPGIYAIRLKIGSTLPEPLESLLAPRDTRLIYIGKATSLKSRMLDNELRGRGHGTFFRSIGAVLGYRPLTGSLASRVSKYNYSFVKPDRRRSSSGSTPASRSVGSSCRSRKCVGRD